MRLSIVLMQGPLSSAVNRQTNKQTDKPNDYYNHSHACVLRVKTTSLLVQLHGGGAPAASSATWGHLLQITITHWRNSACGSAEQPPAQGRPATAHSFVRKCSCWLKLASEPVIWCMEPRYLKAIVLGSSYLALGL